VNVIVVTVAVVEVVWLRLPLLLLPCSCNSCCGWVVARYKCISTSTDESDGSTMGVVAASNGECCGAAEGEICW